MNTSKHTPGPWEIQGTQHICGKGADFPDEGAVFPRICRTYTDDEAPSEYMGAEERKANLHLISAAPDMLEALEEAVRLIEPIASALEDHGYDNAEAANVFFALDRAICAIAKARGEA